MADIVRPTALAQQPGRREVRGVLAGIGLAALILVAAAAMRQQPASAAAAEASAAAGARPAGAMLSSPPGTAMAAPAQHGSDADAAQFQSLSLADLYNRDGAAKDLIAAEKEQKEAADTFAEATRQETKATRELGNKAQYQPGQCYTIQHNGAQHVKCSATMMQQHDAMSQLDANNEAMKKLADDIAEAGDLQESASKLYVKASEKRLKAVEKLNKELVQEAFREYQNKLPVKGTFDLDRYRLRTMSHVARLTGVDSDGSGDLCGYAEVKHGGQWGKICSNGFTETDAAVFCKSMGLTGGKARYSDGTRPTWGSTGTQNMYDQAGTSLIWMNLVNCRGNEIGPDDSILDCPFGTKVAPACSPPSCSPQKQEWKQWTFSNSGCDLTTAVNLCCSPTDFCPPRSQWKAAVHDYSHTGQMYGQTMNPEHGSAEVMANCKCDAGFYMDPKYPETGDRRKSLYAGKCTTCPLNSCSPVGSTSINNCVCLEGFYKKAAGSEFTCEACPANSCSARGITSVNECKCFAGYYMEGGECKMCPDSLTSKPGSTKETQCDMMCGLPDPDMVGDHAEKVADAAVRMADELRAQRGEAKKYKEACEEETAALTALKREMTYRAPATLGKDDYSADLQELQTHADTMKQYAPVIKQAGQDQVAYTAQYLAHFDDLKTAVHDLSKEFPEQLKTSHHLKEALTVCQPMIACVPTPCSENNRPNPCEPWPECYPHPCHPWPSCATSRHPGEFPNVAAADPVHAAASECVDYVGFMARQNPTTALWTCEMMAERQYCQDGGYGPEWKEEWGSFADHPDKFGIDVGRACCVCGGGTKHVTINDKEAIHNQIYSPDKV